MVRLRSLSFRRAGRLQPQSQSFQAGVLVVLTPVAGGEALSHRAAGAVIAIILIVPIFLVVLAKSLGLSRLEAIRKYGLCLMRAERKGASILGMTLGRFWVRTVAPGTASIDFTDLGKKVQDGFGLSRDSLPNDLVPGIFPTIFLLAWARMEGLRPLQNRRIKTGFKITLSTSNS